MTSFLPEENVALAIAIVGDTTLAGLLAEDKVYSGMAPEQTPFSYITIGSMSEAERRMFMKGGAEGKITMNIWTRGGGQMAVAAIYKALNALLYNTRLTLSSGHIMSGKLKLVLSSGGDPSDSLVVRGVVEYTVWAIA